ncbi:hypothetical protein FACS1894111_06720 [Clostridia bacterium]|nr:hypothetical protein FACS1894111_06720 [Clostridia bacterium]
MLNLDRRTFFTVTSIMIVIFFMFQIADVLRFFWNDYHANQYYEDAASDSLTGKDVYRIAEENAQADSNKSYVIYVGDPKSEGKGHIVSQWATYTKRNLVSVTSVDACTWAQENPPEIILLDGDYLNPKSDGEKIRQWTGAGMDVIFCSLPSPTALVSSQDLMDILGIARVTRENVDLVGKRIFEGFLLGGDGYYEPKNEEESAMRQDLVLNAPWYELTGGSKTYMIGLIEDKSVRNEKLPPLMWRYDTSGGTVFAVNDDYIADYMGIGILDAIMAEAHDYEIYPVVNAQNLAFTDFPSFTDENMDQMREYYGTPLRAVYRDIVWPDIASIMMDTGFKYTAMVTPKLDYTAEEEPVGGDFSNYVRLLHQYGAEVGLSGTAFPGVDLNDKIKADAVVLNKNMPNFYYLSLFLQDPNQWNEVKDEELLFATRTIAAPIDRSKPVLSYLTENVTLQNFTDNGFSHTYTEDLRLRGLETALAYTNVSVDMSKVPYPKEAGDRWENLFLDVSKNLATFWKPFHKFDKTTLAQSDQKIRRFLAMDYTKNREKDVITVDIQNFREEADFILRTHGERVWKVSGGTFAEIERGAYIIKAEKEQITISLKQE